MYSDTRFTSSAFVFRPFPKSPRHWSHKHISVFSSSSGFRPSREAPGISSSVRKIALRESSRKLLKEDAIIILWKFEAFVTSFHAVLTRPRATPATIKVVYWYPKTSEVSNPHPPPPLQFFPIRTDLDWWINNPIFSLLVCLFCFAVNCTEKVPLRSPYHKKKWTGYEDVISQSDLRI